MNKGTRERASQLFAALANPSRLRIVELLCAASASPVEAGEGRSPVAGPGLSVNEICAALSLAQSATSQHLATLTRAGILVVEPKGTSRFYRVRGPRILHILALIEEFCQVHELYGVPAEEPDEGAEHPSLTPSGTHERTGSLP